MQNIKKIIISDDIRVALTGKNALSGKEVTVFKASSAEEILRIHRTERADLIIANLTMDGTGVKDICSAIRADNVLKKVSIILVCPANKPLAEESRTCGANAIIKKPVNSRELVQKAAELLNISGREGLREMVKVSVRVSPKEDFFFVVSRNISTSGMLLETDRVMAAGDEIVCSLVLQRRVTVDGKIVRVRKDASGLYHYGIKFLDLDLHAKAQIKEFIESRLLK